MARTKNIIIDECCGCLPYCRLTIWIIGRRRYKPPAGQLIRLLKRHIYHHYLSTLSSSPTRHQAQPAHNVSVKHKTRFPSLSLLCYHTKQRTRGISYLLCSTAPLRCIRQTIYRLVYEVIAPRLLYDLCIDNTCSRTTFRVESSFRSPFSFFFLLCTMLFQGRRPRARLWLRNKVFSEVWCMYIGVRARAMGETEKLMARACIPFVVPRGSFPIRLDGFEWSKGGACFFLSRWKQRGSCLISDGGEIAGVEPEDWLMYERGHDDVARPEGLEFKLGAFSEFVGLSSSGLIIDSTGSWCFVQWHYVISVHP